MLPDLVLFKGCHISWKKEQKQGFSWPKKEQFHHNFQQISHYLGHIFFKNSSGEENILRICHLARSLKINLQDTSSLLNKFLQYASMLKENLLGHPDVQQKILNLEGLISSAQSKFTKKEQNWFFKEPKEHLFERSVLYRT